MDFPLIGTGARDLGIGLTLLGPRLKTPSASSRRMMEFASFSDCKGLITAMGFPRSVKTTSLPALTALIALENLAETGKAR